MAFLAPPQTSRPPRPRHTLHLAHLPAQCRAGAHTPRGTPVSRRATLAATARALAASAAAAAAGVAVGSPPPRRAAAAATSPSLPAFSAVPPTVTLPSPLPLTYQDTFIPSAAGGAGLRRDVVPGVPVIAHFRIVDGRSGAVLADTRAAGAPRSFVAAAAVADDRVTDGTIAGGLPSTATVATAAAVPAGVARGVVGMRTGGRRLLHGTFEAVGVGAPAAPAGGGGEAWVEVAVLKVGAPPLGGP
ncbi:hypothetical protein MMPV_004861 [Pyropia vietnamensis]